MSIDLVIPTGLASIPGVVGGFTTRHGGVSLGPLSTLNLGWQPHERPEHLWENWERVARVLNPRWGARRVALNHQVHGRQVIRVRAPQGPLEPMARADALITDVPGVILAAKSADCVPVVLVAPGAVGVAHAGWRGVAARVVPAAVEALAGLAGCPMSSLYAAVGPHMGVGAYEVGEEVVSALAEAGLDPARFADRSGSKPHVDLGLAVQDQLRALGVEQMDRVGLCTCTHPDLFSHRCDGPDTGRQAGVVALCE